MNIAIDIADAVVGELNAGSFMQEFTAVRAYRPQYELAELKDLRVTVVPAGVEETSAARTITQRDVSIDVGVQKKLTVADAEELDPLMALVEELQSFFRRRRLSGYREAICVKTANEPLYSVEHLDEFRQFTSVIRLTFRVLQEA